MDRKKLIKLVRVFFVLFIMSGIGSILDFYYGRYPRMFANLSDIYEIFKLGHVSVKMPGAPFLILLVLITIAVFLFVIKKLYGRIITEINKEN